jgi:hypothetical protein
MISLTSATLIAGLTAYCILSYLMIDVKYTLPISIAMALLSFGLTSYYSQQYKNSDNQSGSQDLDRSFPPPSAEEEKHAQRWISNFTFVLVYLAMLLLCATLSIPKLDTIYTSWNLLDITDTIGLGAGIMLAFFLPGYTVTLLVIGKNRTSPLLKVLLGYLCSVLITSLTTYISAIYSENDINQNKLLLISVYISILVVFVIYNRVYRINSSKGTNIFGEFYKFISETGNKLQTILRVNSSEIIVFASLFTLLIISTYYLYGGVTIGDQWYHQNRAIFFMHGNFREFITTDGDQSYTPLLSSLLAGATSISGLPLINTYASIAFLNITGVFAFYYFCRTWLPLNNKRAALIGSAFFVIASGFGWMYVLYLTAENPVDSPIDSISYFVEEKIRVTDIRLSSNFMIAAFPDFSTGLTLVSLPAGFVLLGLIRLQFGNKLGYITLIFLVSVSGILFHGEFYLFILVSSILPLIYNLKKKSYLYYAFLITFASVFIVDELSPKKYFTSNSIFGISITELSLIFMVAMLLLYLLRQRWFVDIPTISIGSNEVSKKVRHYANKIRFLPKIVLVTMVIYGLAICFLVWSELPANYVNTHTQNYDTPWYLYPMRLGAIGLLGIAFVLSYIFKKFEREIFVFGIIIVTALLVGPYYNEQRFSKYVMVGMVGFASLMIFKLLNFIGNKQPIAKGIMIGSIVVITSVSTLMYIGYNALVVQTQDYTHALGRRNFPSLDELNVLDLMRVKIQDGPDKNNIATFASEYNFRRGDIISKLHAFSGLPIKKAIQTQYLLNASTLDSFYRLADLSNTGYLMVPTQSVNQITLSDPLRFVFENFQEIHKDDDYLVLDIQAVHGPSTNSESNVGIIKKDKSSPLMLSDRKKLLVTNTTFDFEKDTADFVKVQNGSQGEKTSLYGHKKNGGKTFWSRDLNTEGINYIELSLRSLDETKSGKGTSGLKWTEGNRTYFVSLSDKGLQLREQIPNGDGTVLLSQNTQVKNDNAMWNLKIESLNESINVYVDNLIEIKVPRNLSGAKASSITKVGLNSENNIVEFGPVLLGKFEQAKEDYDISNIRNYYYYPLTSLALSRSEYKVYSEDDQSVFSNSYIILPFDSQDLNDELFNQLLNYTKSGGTLVVINSDDKFQGKFSKLFSITPNVTTTENFIRIARDDNQGDMINVTGTVNDIKLGPSVNTSVVASYINVDNKSIVPFAIEKNMADKGRIIYINSQGYFDAISNNPKKYFSSLVNFSDFLGLDPNSQLRKKNVSQDIKRFIGDVSMTGKISVNTSSFSMTNSSSSSGSVYVKNISISDSEGNLKSVLKNTSVIDIMLAGDYVQLINTSGTIVLPSTQSRQDYLGMSVPNGFNMTVDLLNDKNSLITLVTNNSNSSNSTIRLDNESKINFYNIESESPNSNFVPIVVRTPEITVKGNVFFDKTNFYGQEIDDYIPLNVSGLVKIKFDLIEDFIEPLRHGTKIQYLTYIDALSIEGKRNQANREVEIPGDISPEIKKRGLDVPLLSILTSSGNYIVLAATVSVVILVTFFLRRMHVF